MTWRWIGIWESDVVCRRSCEGARVIWRGLLGCSTGGWGGCCWRCCCLVWSERDSLLYYVLQCCRYYNELWELCTAWKVCMVRWATWFVPWLKRCHCADCHGGEEEQRNFFLEKMMMWWILRWASSQTSCRLQKINKKDEGRRRSR